MNTESKIFSYQSMGTTWKITLWDVVLDSDYKNIQKDIIDMSNIFDKTYSRFIKSSLIWQIANRVGIHEVPIDFTAILRIYMELYLLSDKKLNPLIGFTISDLGYDENYTLIPKDIIRKTPDLLETVKIIDDTHIETKEPVLFDFGAIGKGYFVDKIKSYLLLKNLKEFIVDGSGDIAYVGKGSMRVGLEHPKDPKKVIGVIEMKEGSMCSSGTNKRKWDKYNHVIDPTTISSVDYILATWVIEENTALADALASCLFFVSPENLSKHKFSYCIMNNLGQIKRSEGFNAELF